MELLDMAVSQEQRVAEMENGAKPSLPDEYPYGLRLSLTNKQLVELGIEADDVGEELMIHAKGCVLSMSMENGMEIQLKAIAVMEEKGEDKEPKSSYKATTMMGYYK